MKNFIVFLGPTLDQKSANEILPAAYRPPAAHGDVISAVINDRPDAIVLIDGVTISDNAVWPKELLFALEKGVHLFGAAAHGALRAMEIPGMIGVGWVFEQFTSGVLEADDEIECQWHKSHDGYLKTSLSLVNIRATLSFAVKQGLITEHDAVKLVTEASRLYFPDRTISNLVGISAKIGIAEAKVIEAIFQKDYQDIQAKDAEMLLHGLASGHLLEVSKPPITMPAPKTLFFHMLYDNDRKVRHNEVELPLYMLRNEIALSHPDAEDIFFAARLRRAVIAIAGQLGLIPEEREVTAEALRFRQKRNLQDDEPFQSWLKENDLTKEDFIDLMTGFATVSKLTNLKDAGTKEVLNEVRLRGEYQQWKARAAETETALEKCRKKALDRYNQSTPRSLLKQYSKTRIFPWSVDIGQVTSESGLQSNALSWELAKRIVIDEEAGSPSIEDLFSLIEDSQ